MQRALKGSGSAAEPVQPRPSPRRTHDDESRLPAWEPIAEEAPPRIPNWEPPDTTADEADRGWADSGEPSFAPGVLHVRTAEPEQERRTSRTVIIVAAVACLLIVVLAATAVYTSLHHSTPAPTATTGAPEATATAGLSPATASRIHRATANMLADTTRTEQQLRAIPGFPTTTKTARVINPYISSLQDYRDFLSAQTVPADGRGALHTATAQISDDLSFLATINGLEPIRLGTWLVQFGSNTVDVQTAVSSLEQVLHIPTS